MSLKSLLGALAQTPLSPLVLEEPRFESVAVRTAQDCLQVEVVLASLGFVALGAVRASARFTALLERTDADGVRHRREVATIEAAVADFRRAGVGHARAELEVPGAPLERLSPRAGAARSDEVSVVHAAFSDLVITDPTHRLLSRVRGHWALTGAPLAAGAAAAGAASL
jgi:hypothetical protein